ncbi:MAG: hypothetical protein QW249_01810 [Desulfurococcaceae archaeon]
MSEKDRRDILLSRAREFVERSKETDYVMPIILPFIPAIMMVIGSILLIIGFITWFIHGGILVMIGFVTILSGIIINFYVIYKWIERRNKHFERTLLFFEIIGEIAVILGFKRTYIIKTRLNELKAINSTMRSALGNTILTILPLYIYYVYHFLNKDFAKHSEKERLLLNEIFDELKERNQLFVRRLEEFRDVPDRSTLLYFILTFLTGGLFLIYWVYTLTKDPNTHFESHSVIERDIMDALANIVARTKEH